MLEETPVVTSQKDEYKTTRLMYIFEAALEYFITLTLSGAYISRITAYLGVADDVTATLISMLSLTHVLQFIALIISHIKPVKKWVTSFYVLSHIFAIFTYFVPVFDFDNGLKVVLLFAFLIISRSVNYVVNAPKISWLMSSVDDSKRGEFTGIKEIVSLISGSVFIYLLGYSLDIANKKVAFIVVGIILSVVSVLHITTLLFSKEKPQLQKEKVDVLGDIKTLFTNKEFIKVVIIFAVWYLVNYGVVNFTGTYQVHELGFTATYTSIISIVAMLIRAVLSKAFGKFGDRHTFMKLIILSFSIEIVAFIFLTFTVPANGKIMFLIYYVLHTIGMSGISISMINLTYEVVPHEQRTSAYAVTNATAGVSGFIITLILNPIFKAIQDNGNVVLGIPMYAQQLFAFIAVIAMTIVVIWLILSIKKSNKETA